MVVEAQRYQYNPGYIPDQDAFRDAVLSKTVKPHQVEWQPGPAGKICWLQCPYCYGGSALDTDERLPLTRALHVLDEIAEGGVEKVIFAGYATDPLNAPDIAMLVGRAMANNMVIGFNTKALRVGKDLRQRLLAPIRDTSYMSVSVDAGSDAMYNAVHGVKNDSAQLYQRVLENVGELVDLFGNRRPRLEIAATYLVNRLNATAQEITRFLTDFTTVGVDVIRFAFAQPPRGGGEMPTVPTENECDVFRALLRPLIERWDSADCRVLLVDADTEHGLRRARTLPCVARWVYPAVGYDGWLYPCSQTGAPNFRSFALGDLHTRDFWELYYEYDAVRLSEWMAHQHRAMEHAGCRCDRKEHLVNIQAGSIFGGV